MSANGQSIVWTQATGFSGVMFSQNGAAFAASSGLPSGTIQVASDKQNGTVFYAASGNQLFISVDGGQSFTQLGTLGSATSTQQIAASPFTAGEFFVSTDHGVWHATNYGKQLSGLGGLTAAWSIAVGKGASSGAVSLYAAGTIDGANSLYRTDDLGSTWAKLPTTEKALGSASGMILAADPNTYSQVFVGTNGRGIFVGHA